MKERLLSMQPSGRRVFVSMCCITEYFIELQACVFAYSGNRLLWVFQRGTIIIYTHRRSRERAIVW